VIEVLRCLRYLRFGLHGFLQGTDGGVRGDFQREEVGILVRGSGDIERDAPAKKDQSSQLEGGVKACTDMLPKMRRLEVNGDGGRIC